MSDSDRQHGMIDPCPPSALAYDFVMCDKPIQSASLQCNVLPSSENCFCCRGLDLDVSMFERLVTQQGFPVAALVQQRRMRPQISR